MNVGRIRIALSLLLAVPALVVVSPIEAQQMVTETRDPRQQQDAEFAKLYAQWTSEPRYGSPLVDHLPKVEGIPTPNDVLGYYIGAPKKLTYYADILKYYRALDAASPRVHIETIGRSDEGRELVVVWVSSEANIANLQQNRDNMAKIADPRGRSESAPADARRGAADAQSRGAGAGRGAPPGAGAGATIAAAGSSSTGASAGATRRMADSGRGDPERAVPDQPLEPVNGLSVDG